MKILYGITKSNFGGAQRYVFDLALEAQKRGSEVAVVLGGRGELTKRLEVSGIRTIELPSLARDISLVGDAKEFFSLLKIISRERPDVFHVNSSKMGGLGTLAGRLVNLYFKLQTTHYKLQTIFTSHGWAFNETWRPGWQKFLIKVFSWLIVFLSHKTICVSEKTRTDISSWPFTQNKLTVVHNGIDKFELKDRSVARRELGVEENDLVIGTLAELHKVKGLDVLLKAWQIFSRENSSKLLILGRGEEEENLKNMAKNLGILDKVKFLGFVADARTLLVGFDIFVLPSRSENLPYAILEAGVAGLSVVASAVGGIPEIITDGENGFLVESENQGMLAEKLVLLAGNIELRTKLGENLRQTIIENFSKEKMAAETFALYA